MTIFLKKLGDNYQTLTNIALWDTIKLPHCLCIKCERSVLNILHSILHFADLKANSASKFWCCI